MKLILARNLGNSDITVTAKYDMLLCKDIYILEYILVYNTLFVLSA